LIGGVVTILTAILALAGILPLFVPALNLEFLPYANAAEQFIAVLGQLLGVLTYAGLGGLIGLMTGGGIAILIPYSRARGRNRNIGLVLPAGVYYMHALAVSGMSKSEIIQRASEAEDNYGEFAAEMKRISYKINIQHKDFQTAVREVAESTPNPDLKQFLVGMISTLGSGGEIVQYLENQKKEQQNVRERQLENVSDYIRMFGEMYTVSILLPMLLVIVLIIMALVGQPNTALMLITVYALIPLINIAFGVMIASVKIDDMADGYIRASDGSIPGRVSGSPFNPDTELEYLGEDPIFEHIYRQETESKFVDYVFREPVRFFKQYPKYVLFLTFPIALIGLGILGAVDQLALSWTEFTNEPIKQTAYWVYWPAVSILLPYTILFEYNEHTRSGILDTLADDFRALADYNSNGVPLPDAMRDVAENSNSKLANEFGIIYNKLSMRKPLEESLLEFNNKYRIPESARQVIVLRETQAVSTRIDSVLRTAAETAQYQQQAIDDRLSKMKAQFFIIQGVFFIFILIIAGMDIFLIDFAQNTLEGSEEVFSGFQNVTASWFTTIFLHAALFQGICGGLLGGFVKSDRVEKGLKYALINATLVMLVWGLMPIYEPALQGLM
jgi:flagellar protein FlaJ